MANPRDTTIDIPLTTVTSRTGARKTSSHSPTGYGREESYPDLRNNEKEPLRRRYPAGRRRKINRNEKGKMGADGEEDTLTQMGKVYDKILNFSIVTRYFLYVLPLALIIAIPIVIGATARPTAALGGVRIVWFFSWVEIVWLSLWVSKLFAKTLPWIFQFLCGIVSSGTRKYMLVLKALEIPLSLVGWALTSLATFIPIMTRNPTARSQQKKKNEQQADQATTTAPPAASATAGAFNSLSAAFDPKSKNGTEIQHWESVVNKILAALLVASLLLLIEKLIIQLISIGYHRKQFNAKIRESKHNIHLLSLLYDASRALFPAYCNEFAEEDYIINDSLHIGDSTKGSGHNRSGSATPMRLLQNVGRFGDKVTSVFGNIAHEVTGKQVFNPGSAHSIVVEALEKNKSSEALAKRLWMSFVVEGKEALYEEDIVEVLGEEHYEEAEECFACLDRDSNGDVSLDEMILTVCEFGRERHSIANSLHDVDQAINVLDGLLCTIVFVICIFVFGKSYSSRMDLQCLLTFFTVAFLNASFTTTLATAGTALLSLSFVFAVTAQEVLGSCIFLFVKHPFDVLDRVDISDQQLIVEHISLLFTVFKAVNTGKITQTANIVLNTQWIQNVSRSKAMKEQLLLYINFDTTLEDIQLLKQEMQNFVRDKDNSRDFQPDVDVEVTGIAEMNKLELKVEIRHKSNWANETVRAARRSKFMCALVLALRKIPIYAPGGGDAVLGSNDKPTYAVAVSDEEAAAAREAYKKTKEEKRLVPSKKPDPVPDTAVSSATDSNPADPAAPPPLRYRLPPLAETAAMSDLNSRDPAADTARDVLDLDVSATPDDRVSSDSRRSNDIEEVRGLLRRQSTRGKRKASSSVSAAQIPPVISENVPSTAAAPPNFSPTQSSASAFQAPQPGASAQYQSFPPRTTSSQLPPLQFDTQQYRPQQPQQSTTLQSPTSPMTEVGSTSPLSGGNQYPLQEMRSQQSLQDLHGQQSPPQMRRPVPGGNNAFAREARERDAQGRKNV